MTPECFLPFFSRAHPAQVRRRRVRFRFKSTEGVLDVSIARHDFELIAVVKFQRRLQGKEVFLAIITFQRFGNVLGAALDLGMLKLGQLEAVPFAGKDSRKILIPVTPVMSLMTRWSWTFISVKAFCMRCTRLLQSLLRVSRRRR